MAPLIVQSFFCLIDSGPRPVFYLFMGLDPMYACFESRLFRRSKMLASVRI